MTLLARLAALASGVVVLLSAVPINAQPIPGPMTPEELVRPTVERRAIEAVNWGMPAVNYDRLAQPLLQGNAPFNQILFWSGFSDWKNQSLTPNPDTVYFKPFFTTKDAGPLVLEIPPASDAGSLTGTIMDSWQAALEDVGPAGIDKGKGAKFLILPPGYKAPVPAGYTRWRPTRSKALRCFAPS